MTKKMDKNMPVGHLKRVVDFLPPPEELLPKSEMERVTIEIEKDTVEFFKRKAKQMPGGKYQRMMREVLKGYAKKYG